MPILSVQRDCECFLPPSLLSISVISSPLKGSIASSSQFFFPSTSLSRALEIPGSSTIIPSIFTGTAETTRWVFILELHWKLTEECAAGRLEMGDNQCKGTGGLISCCYLCPVNTGEWRQVNRTKVCFPKQSERVLEQLMVKTPRHPSPPAATHLQQF